MSDAGLALRKAYVQLLADLTYQGKPVAVYSLQAPNSAQAPYVILGPWVQQTDNTKDSFGQTGEINLDVVTRFPGDVRSAVPAGAIADSITDLVKPDPTAEVLDTPGFRNWNTVIVSTTDLSQPTSTDTIIRKIITVSHSLTQA